MATIDIIKANLAAAVPELTNFSETDPEYKIAEVVANTDDAMSAEITNSQNIISNVIATQRYGRGQYYINAALAYQQGDNLTIDQVTFDSVYNPVITAHQIIKQVAFIAGSAQVGIKVAVADPTTGGLKALTGSDLAAFNSYMQNFAIPGIILNIYSDNGNLLSFTMQYNYYSGYDLGNLKTILAAQLTAFQNSYQFNGQFFVTDLSQFLQQNVPGTRSVYFTNTTIDGIAFIDTTLISAGYFNYDTNIDSLIANATFNAI